MVEFLLSHPIQKINQKLLLANKKMDGEKEQRSGNISKDLYAEQHEFIAQILGRTKCLGEQVETRYRQKYLVSVCFHTFLTNALIVYLERRTRVL